MAVTPVTSGGKPATPLPARSGVTLDTIAKTGIPLHDGDSGPAVDRAKMLLRAAGFPGSTGPTYDAATSKAVANFQATHGLKVDGQIGRDTLAALEKEPALKVGMSPPKAPTPAASGLALPKSSGPVVRASEPEDEEASRFRDADICDTLAALLDRGGYASLPETAPAGQPSKKLVHDWIAAHPPSLQFVTPGEEALQAAEVRLQKSAAAAGVK